MSTSTSNLPAIILAVVVIALLAVFYWADRSSSPDMSDITHHADTDKMVSSKQKYEAHKSVFDHSGYSGSLKDYLHHTKNASSAADPSVKEHTGYSGSGKDYVQKHSAENAAKLQANANEHAGFSGSLKTYLSGNYEHRSAGKKKQHASSSNKSSKSAGEHSATTSYSGSVDKYLKKYGN